MTVGRWQEPTTPAAPEPAEKKPSELTDQTYESVLGKGRHMVKFYAPWCGHCQKLAPVWDELAASLEHQTSLRVSKVDCTVNRAACNHYEVKAYPTLLWIEDGKLVERYQGGRSHEELKEFVVRMLGSSAEREKAESGVEVEDAVETQQEQPPLVMELSDGNFQGVVDQGTTFVKFFAPW